MYRRDINRDIQINKMYYRVINIDKIATAYRYIKQTVRIYCPPLTVHIYKPYEMGFKKIYQTVQTS
jgi:hypothetical protein